MSNVSSASSGGNRLRITGMASGLDVDATVKKMLTADQTKVDKAKQDQQISKWKQEMYQDIIKDIKDLQNSFFDTTSSDKNILSSTNYAGFDVTGGDSSVANITADAGAQVGAYKLSVVSLATKTSTTGNNLVNDTSSGYSDGNWNGQKIGFKIDGAASKEITLDSATLSLNDRVADINAKINLDTDLKGKVQAVVSAGKVQFQTLSSSRVEIDNVTTSVSSDLDNLKNKLIVNSSLSTTLQNLGVSSSTDSFDIVYNGTRKTISVKNTDKLSDVINNISTATSGSVTASFSQLTGKLVIQSANAGSSQSISIEKGTGSGNTLQALGLTDASNNPIAAVPGTDAVVKITPPGATAPTTVTKSTNNFTIDGISYNLTGKNTPDDITVNVTTNADKVFDKIKSFIDKYNSIIDKIQTKLLEKKDSTYKPLTDEQKESMSDTEITAWETKAKTGLLRNDQNLQNLLNDLKSAFTSRVSGSGLTIGSYGSSSIGLDTSTDYSKPAHIDIKDASKLKSAIANNGGQILELFTNVSSSSDKKTAYNENGIFARIKNILQDNVGYTNTTLNTAILTKYANKQDDFSSTGTAGTNTLPNQIYQQQLLIDKLKTAFSDKQEAYYQKFSKLETAMESLNSQQSYIQQMIGS